VKRTRPTLPSSSIFTQPPRVSSARGGGASRGSSCSSLLTLVQSSQSRSWVKGKKSGSESLRGTAGRVWRGKSPSVGEPGLLPLRTHEQQSRYQDRNIRTSADFLVRRSHFFIAAATNHGCYRDGIMKELSG
jgi:hypothetical protein